MQVGQPNDVATQTIKKQVCYPHKRVGKSSQVQVHLPPNEKSVHLVCKTVKAQDVGQSASIRLRGPMCLHKAGLRLRAAWKGYIDVESARLVRAFFVAFKRGLCPCRHLHEWTRNACGSAQGLRSHLQGELPSLRRRHRLSFLARFS